MVSRVARTSVAVAAVCLSTALAACTALPDSTRSAAPSPTPSSAALEVQWRADSEVVLPNLDDDSGRCATVTNLRCHDAADEVINGDEDVADLTQVHSPPLAVSDAASARVRVIRGADKVRVFVRQGNVWSVLDADDRLSAAQLQAGLTVGVEGLDFVREPDLWDGRVTVALKITDGTARAQHRVRLRIAPMLTTTHLMDLQQVLITAPDETEKTRTFADALSRQVAAAGVPGGVRLLPGAYVAFPQDMMEQFYFTRASANSGTEQSLSVLGVAQRGREWRAGVRSLRGPGVGVVELGLGGDGSGFSFGNLETLPPRADDPSGDPNGRILIGMDQARAGRSSGRQHILDLLRAQRAQDPIVLDVSHLGVGHVDEMFQVLPADTPRGWRLAVSDTRAGVKVLRRAQAEGAGQ